MLLGRSGHSCWHGHRLSGRQSKQKEISDITNILLLSPSCLIRHVCNFAHGADPCTTVASAGNLQKKEMRLIKMQSVFFTHATHCDVSIVPIALDGTAISAASEMGTNCCDSGDDRCIVDGLRNSGLAPHLASVSTLPFFKRLIEMNKSTMKK